MIPEDKPFVSYILYENELGLVSETKFKNILDLQIIKNNDAMIETFYDEHVKFLNTSGMIDQNNNIMMVADYEFITLSQEDMYKNVISKLNLVLNEAAKSQYIDYKRVSNDHSVLDSIKIIASKLNMCLNEKEENFNQDKYLKAYKELDIFIKQMYTDSNIRKNIQQIKSGILDLNTFLAANECIDIKADSKALSNFNVDRSNEDEDTYYFDYTSFALFNLSQNLITIKPPVAKHKYKP